MKERVRLASFNSQSELAVARTKLKSEQITCWVEDELTVQSYNFISQAIGGIKLFVYAKDFDVAYTILQEGGFLPKELAKPNKVDLLLSNPKTFQLIKKLFWAFIAAIAVSLAGMIVYFL